VGRELPQYLVKAESSPTGVNLYFSGVGVGGGGGVEARLFRQQASSPPGSISSNDDTNTKLYIN
jgi:hypothetical protein